MKISGIGSQPPAELGVMGSRSFNELIEGIGDAARDGGPLSQFALLLDGGIDSARRVGSMTGYWPVSWKSSGSPDDIAEEAELCS